MPKIFICYRREDTAYEATTIYEFLEPRFGQDKVFMDVDTIPAGVDFRQYLHDAVTGCDAVLVVIGSDWLSDQDGNRRLDDPRDFVRIEVEAALQRDIRVIPVLVRDATMPSPGDLPDRIQGLSFRHAVQVRAGRDFRTDMNRLIRELEVLPSSSETPPSPVQPAVSLGERRTVVPTRKGPDSSETRDPIAAQASRRRLKAVVGMIGAAAVLAIAVAVSVLVYTSRTGNGHQHGPQEAAEEGIASEPAAKAAAEPLEEEKVAVETAEPKVKPAPVPEAELAVKPAQPVEDKAIKATEPLEHKARESPQPPEDKADKAGERLEDKAGKAAEPQEKPAAEPEEKPAAEWPKPAERPAAPEEDPFGAKR